MLRRLVKPRPGKRPGRAAGRARARPAAHGPRTARLLAGARPPDGDERVPPGDNGSPPGRPPGRRRRTVGLAADRREALRLLAELPPPPDAPTVELLAKKARSRNTWPGATPELLTWRDGTGLLYEGARPLQALTFLRYLRFVELYTESRGGDAAALGRWIERRLRREPSRPLHDLVHDATLPEGLRPAPGTAPERVVIPYPGPGEGATVAVLLDPVIGARPTRFFWQIWYDDGHGEPELHEVDGSVHGHDPADLVQALRAPLGRLLRARDQEGRPVPLEVALPVEHFDTAVHRWRFDDIAELNDAGHLGARRRVVLRALERREIRTNSGPSGGRRWPPSGASAAGAVWAGRLPGAHGYRDAAFD
ncbi:hypothetical protein STENM223S_02086 [Streptomyces tendae]